MSELPKSRLPLSNSLTLLGDSTISSRGLRENAPLLKQSQSRRSMYCTPIEQATSSSSFRPTVTFGPNVVDIEKTSAHNKSSSRTDKTGRQANFHRINSQIYQSGEIHNQNEYSLQSNLSKNPIRKAMEVTPQNQKFKREESEYPSRNTSILFDGLTKAKSNNYYIPPDSIDSHHSQFLHRQNSPNDGNASFSSWSKDNSFNVSKTSEYRKGESPITWGIENSQQNVTHSNQKNNFIHNHNQHQPASIPIPRRDSLMKGVAHSKPPRNSSSNRSSHATIERKVNGNNIFESWQQQQKQQQFNQKIAGKEGTLVNKFRSNIEVHNCMNANENSLVRLSSVAHGGMQRQRRVSTQMQGQRSQFATEGGQFDAKKGFLQVIQNLNEILSKVERKVKRLEDIVDNSQRGRISYHVDELPVSKTISILQDNLRMYLHSAETQFSQDSRSNCR